MLSFSDVYQLLTAAYAQQPFGVLSHYSTPSCSPRHTFLHPVSHVRDFDLSECFEYAVVLPLPMALLLLVGVWQLWQVRRGKWGPKRRRHGRSLIKLRMKMAFAFLSSVASAITTALLIHLSTQPHPVLSRLSIFPPALFTLTTLVLVHVLHTTHYHSIRSSSLVLTFFPLWFLAFSITLRTHVLVGQGLQRSGRKADTEEIAAFATWILSTSLACVAWLVECAGPEGGSIRLVEDKQGFQRISVDGSLSEDAEEEGSQERLPAIEQNAVREFDEEKERELEVETPMLRANIYSVLTFGWLTPMMKLGSKRYITEDDMWPLPPSDAAESLNARLTSTWQHQRDLVAQGRKKRASLKIALVQAFGSPYFVAGVLKALYDCLSFAQPQMLRLLLSFVQSYAPASFTGADRPPGAQEPIRGYAIAVGMFVLANMATAMLHQYFDRCFATTMRIKGALVTLIYKKSLVLSNGERGGRTTGDIVNLQSVDAVRIADLCQYGHIAWSGPLQILLAFVSLYNLLGWQAFMGVAVMVISLPINTAIARKLKELQKEQMKNKDARTRLMNEILTNIKSIKLYGWEKSFSERVLDVRNNRELRMIRRIGITNAFSFFFWATTPTLVAFASFSAFALTSKQPLTSEKIFPAISLFQLLSFPLAMFSNIISSIIEAVVSVSRLETFLNAEELQKDARMVILPGQRDGYETPSRGQDIVTIEHGEFKWNTSVIEPTLHDINLTVKKGELLAVLGRVGDGKTSLLSCILGEMTRTEGSVLVRGEIAYFAQNSFILSATIKENIVFGHRLDQEFYEIVLDACALRPDLAILPQGDLTEVGEKGVSLSGGQKARIALARAVYARADLYLLDDPLSAVDAHVGKHIFDHVIGPHGLLKTKARILCTNMVTYLPETDDIVMLRRGIILERNDYQTVMTETDSELYKLITGLGKQAAESDSEKEGSESPTVVNEDLSDVDIKSDVDEDELRHPKIERRLSVSTMRRASMLSAREAKLEAIRDLKESSKPKEHQEKGQVKTKVYMDYIKAASRLGVASFLLCILLSQAASILGNVVLRYWGSENSKKNANVHTGRYLFAYGMVGLASSVLSVTATVILWVYCAVRCSRELHDSAFAALMRSPLSFFELTPQGRILNLFSRDVFVVDEVLVRVFSGFFRTFASILGVLVVIAFGAPIVLVAVLPMALIYRLIMRYYLSTSRELKRLDAVSRSPVFAWFGETLSGVSTIRAYNQQSRFIASNEARVDRNQCCYMPAMSVNRWLAVRLEALGSCLMFFVALTAVTAMVIGNNVDDGLVGLVMSYVISVTGALNWVVRSASEVEQNIVSAERILGYTALPSEAPAEIAENKPAPSWPHNGTIEFQNYCARYRPELDLCLKNISLRIEGGEKIGVCGRTGAGKSSLTLALFRIIEATSGKIVIDNVNIATIGLQDLRSVISIIPQDPQLFEGTLRGNIDPTHVASDAEIWRALEQSYLKDFVMRSMGGSLDAEVTEGGGNLSAGQRQLICFARALLRKTKVLILDEATSSIDLETDEAVQRILRGPDFKGVTTITIAHRINTIMDSTRVLVLEQGHVAEFDTPENLLSDKDSIFSSLVGQAGLGSKSGEVSGRASKATSIREKK